MKEIYFDTNVYTHIHNRSGGVTNADVARLVAAIKADKIRILASTQVIEETISAILSSPREALGRLRLIHKLAKRKRMIKPHTDFVQAAKGLRGLLEIRPLQIGTLGPISDLYAISYEGRVPKRSDSRDMQHVLLSSATDAFVTNDKNLRRLMNQEFYRQPHS